MRERAKNLEPEAQQKTCVGSLLSTALTPYSTPLLYLLVVWHRAQTKRTCTLVVA